MGVAEGELEIGDLQADAAIVPLLEQDRVWAAYALCDLEPPQRQYARYIGAVRHGQTSALVLVYAPPGFTSLSTYGAVEDLRRLVARAPALPPNAYVLIRHAHVPALEERYRIVRSWTMLRFAVSAATLQPPLPGVHRVQPLGPDDLPEMQALYATWPDTVFNPLMLEQGIYFGVYEDGSLVSVAGTHAYSLRYQAGVIGNVYTHPAHRGKGLAAAITRAVAAALLEAGVREVVLNVKDDNHAAIAVYRRIGFTVRDPFWEGEVTLR
jgi:ribosomal protein S18 acetylase RimI-like enzyme